MMDFSLLGQGDAFADKFGLLGLTYDDVLLLPDASSIMPSEVDTTTRLSLRCLPCAWMTLLMDLEASNAAIPPIECLNQSTDGPIKRCPAVKWVVLRRWTERGPTRVPLVLIA